MPANGKGSKHTSYVAVTATRLTSQDSTMRECDLDESFQRGHGAGGQHQNKVSSAVRLRHKPTGLEVFINGRSQQANRRTARFCLAGKLREWSESREMRAAYAGAGRGDKIRTYNLQDNRVTDHRNGIKLHQPDQILKEGRFDMLR